MEIDGGIGGGGVATVVRSRWSQWWSSSNGLWWLATAASGERWRYLLGYTEEMRMISRDENFTDRTTIHAIWIMQYYTSFYTLLDEEEELETYIDVMDYTYIIIEVYDSFTRHFIHMMSEVK
ncbi:Uncharacterized protein Fot_35242 [Forsythia ovata]|uniref:Uncharacterized protein n=1 Tax=Forsythia ovata TaxID=205694 RepID=A0ABD1SKZ1_9LAMI